LAIIISTSKDINSPKEIIWKIISDIDNDPNYWQGIRETRNLKKEGNTIERETIISFRQSKSQEIVTFERSNQITTSIIKGPIIGKKVLKLTEISDNKCSLAVNWDIQIQGIMRMFTPMVKKHILKGTIKAIDRIAKEGENRYNKTSV